MTTIGTVPGGWKQSALCDLVEILDSVRVPVSSKERESRPGDVPYYGATGQVGFIDRALFDEDLLLLGEDGVQFFDPLKPKAYEISGPSWVNNHAHVLRVRPERFHQTLLMHYLNHFDYRGTANGTTRLKLTLAAMKRIPVVTPPIAEQERIVEILEEHLSRLDAALASIRTVRDKAAQFRRSLLRDALGGSLAGEFGGPWGTRQLGDLADVRYGYTASADADPVGPRFLRITDIQEDGVAWGDVPHCEIDAAKFHEQQLREGDIVFARTGATTGKSYLVRNPPEAVAASYLIRVRAHAAEVSPAFLAHFFNSDDYWNQIRTGTTGTAQGGFNATKLRDLTVMCPPLDVQEALARRIDALCSVVATTVAAADGVEARGVMLRRSLLHAAFTGRLTEDWRAQHDG